MKKLFAIFTISMLLTSAAKAAETSGNLPSNPPAGFLLNQEVPVGGIIMWWGARSYVNDTNMPNWQICNGEAVKPGSPLLALGITNVPNLEGKFAKGADSNITACPTVPQGAGRNTISGLLTKEVWLNTNQIPAHSHDVGNAIAKHSHDTQADYIFAPGGGGSRRLIMQKYQDGRWPLAPGKGGVTPKPLAGITYSIVGPAKLGNVRETDARGGGQGHAHDVPDFDSRPEYANVFYLIRVK